MTASWGNSASKERLTLWRASDGIVVSSYDVAVVRHFAAGLLTVLGTEGLDGALRGFFAGVYTDPEDSMVRDTLATGRRSVRDHGEVPQMADIDFDLIRRLREEIRRELYEQLDRAVEDLLGELHTDSSIDPAGSLYNAAGRLFADRLRLLLRKTEDLDRRGEENEDR